jgi:hypothetical protein
LEFEVYFHALIPLDFHRFTIKLLKQFTHTIKLIVISLALSELIYFTTYRATPLTKPPQKTTKNQENRILISQQRLNNKF